jgi:hypothetical protein
MPEETKITKTNIKKLFEKAGLAYEEKDGKSIAIIGDEELDVQFGDDGVSRVGDSLLIEEIVKHIRNLRSVFSDGKRLRVGKRLLGQCTNAELKEVERIIPEIRRKRKEEEETKKKLEEREEKKKRLEELKAMMDTEKVQSVEDISAMIGKLDSEISSLGGGNTDGTGPSEARE